jgi:signal transduction histidine kinase
VFDASYSTSEDGTGLGLAIVEQVVDAHGWTVDVTDSTVGTADDPPQIQSDGGPGACGSTNRGARFEVTF